MKVNYTKSQRITTTKIIVSALKENWIQINSRGIPREHKQLDKWEDKSQGVKVEVNKGTDRNTDKNKQTELLEMKKINKLNKKLRGTPYQ